ncbi:ASCH domain-containing protein [Salmonella enterica subsp. enterica serovar Bareilly]
MANLQLAVKGEYFDAMIRGEKTEEYRLCNDYWNKRIMFREYDRLIITKGYPKRDDSSRRIDVPYDGCQQRVKSDPLTATTNGLILIHLVYSGLASAITPAFRFCFSR